MNTPLKTIAINYGTSFLGIIASLIYNFWILRLVVHRVDPEEFGAYVYVLALTQVTTLFLLGIDSSAILKIANAIGKSDWDTYQRTVWQLRTCSKILLMIGLLIAVFFYAFYNSKYPDTKIPWGKLWSIGIVSVSIQVFSKAEFVILTGREKLVVLNIIRCIAQAASMIVSYIFITHEYGVLALSISELFNAICLYALSRRAVSFFGFDVNSPQRDSWKNFSSLFHEGLLLIVGSVGAMIEYQSDTILIENLLTDGLIWVGIYSIWCRFPAMAYSTCLAFSGAMLPTFIQLNSKHSGQTDLIRPVMAKICRIEIIISTMAALSLALWLPSVVRNWVGTAFLFDYFDVLSMGLAFWVAVRSRFTLLNQFLIGTEKIHVSTAIFWASAILKILTIIILVPIWKYINRDSLNLMIMMPWCTGFVMLAINMVMTFYFVRKDLMPMSEFLIVALQIGLIASSGVLSAVMRPLPFDQTIFGIVLTTLIIGVSALYAISRIRSGFSAGDSPKVVQQC